MIVEKWHSLRIAGQHAWVKRPLCFRPSARLNGCSYLGRLLLMRNHKFMTSVLFPLFMWILASGVSCSQPAPRADPEPVTLDGRPLGPNCDDIADSSDCAKGRRCCPLPPGLYEFPQCLVDCSKQPVGHCRKVMGEAAECNQEAGCCFVPKVRRP
jgi:hypothetical protein